MGSDIVDVTTFKFKFHYPRKMADMAQISNLANLILTHFEEIQFGIEPGQIAECFERAKSIMSVISQINQVDPSKIEQFVAQLSQMISKATSKIPYKAGPLHDENFHKILTHQQTNRLPRAHDNREQWVEELSNTCWMFLQKLDHLFRRSLGYISRQDEKQNRNQSHALDVQTLELFIKEMNQFAKQIEKIKLCEGQNKKEMSLKSKMDCESEGGKKQDNSQSKSSCRSLLTEKLKNITTVENDQENGVFCVEDKIVIKGNWVLREIKGYQNEKGSQPQQILSCQEESYEANIRSLGVPIVNRKPQKTELPLKRGILQQMRPFEEGKKEKKVHKNESGCARCEIY